MKKFWIGAGVATALTLAGCGGGEEKKAETPKTESAAAPAGGAGVPDEANGGTVTGKVAFDGAKPTMKNLDMSATPFCTRAHAGGTPSEEVVVNGNGTLKNAFVWVKSGLPDRQWQTSTAPIVLDQSGCMYKPHVLAVMTGQNITIKNSDQTNHNIHPIPKVNQEWNESQPPGSADKAQSFPRQEIMLPVKCNIHPWMRVLCQRRRPPVLRRHRRRRVVYNKRTASGDLHHRSRTREVSAPGGTGHRWG